MDVHADFNAELGVQVANPGAGPRSRNGTSLFGAPAREAQVGSQADAHRRVNIIFFLNDGWDEHFGGELELWRAPGGSAKVPTPEVVIEPSFNRLVVFNHTDRAFHGHPWPLRVPPDKTRRSLALYYYTRGRPPGEAAAQAHSTLYQGARALCAAGPRDGSCYRAGAVLRVPGPRGDQRWGRREPRTRTAFCISGNIREGHEREAAQRLREQLDRLDPRGVVFAYVNPCASATKPWWWDKPWALRKTQGRPWAAPTCETPWLNSSFLEVLKPARLEVYGESDVAPPAGACGDTLSVVQWGRGTYQSLKAVSRCFRLVQEWEERHGRFDAVVRLRPDQCRDEDYCGEITYCSVDQINKSAGHLHVHSEAKKVYWDNFAILPRSFADAYFTAVEAHAACKGQEAYAKRAPVVYAEDVLSSHIAGRFPVLDHCECHSQATCTCQHGGPDARLCRW